jgi:hypothetical protein
MRLIDRLAQEELVLVLADNRSVFVAQAGAQTDEGVWATSFLLIFMGLFPLIGYKPAPFGLWMVEVIGLIFFFWGLHHHVSVKIIVVEKAERRVYFLEEGFGERKTVKFSTSFDEISRVRYDYSPSTRHVNPSNVLHVDFTNRGSWKFCNVRSGSLVVLVKAALQKILLPQ